MIEISASPNHPEEMSSLKIWVNWLNDDNLNMQIFNPTDYPERVATFSMGETDSIGSRMRRQTMTRDSITVSYGEQNGYLFLRLGRNDSVGETIFDTRLGPLNSGNGFISLTTTLPTPYFYGLKGTNTFQYETSA
jgi:hypothetical protein